MMRCAFDAKILEAVKGGAWVGFRTAKGSSPARAGAAAHRSDARPEDEFSGIE